MMQLFFFFLSLVLAYGAERLLENSPWRSYCVIAATVFFVVSFILFLLRNLRQNISLKPLLECYFFCSAALVLYVLQIELIEPPRLRQLFQALWPFVLLLGALPLITSELAWQKMRYAPMIETSRLTLAIRSAKIIALALITFASVNYAASVWNKKVDLSYFKTTKVGDSTQKIVKDITQPLEFILFFPPNNEVLEHIRFYLDSLVELNQKLSIKVVDQALNPELAKELKIRNNGFVVVRSPLNARQEQLSLGLDIEKARNTLRDLDREMQIRILSTIRPPRILYVTTGHLERDFLPMANDSRLGLSQFKLLAENLGFNVKRLGLSEGLDRQVPSDAALVAIIDPKEAFLKSEMTSIEKYWQQGGKIMLAMDPESDPQDKALLSLFNLTLNTTLVSNEKHPIRMDGRAQSPHNFLTTEASWHASIASVKKSSERTGVVFLGAGKLQTKSPQVQFTLNAEQGVPVVAAIENQTARAIVVSDGDVFGNTVVRNLGNSYLVFDSLRWLAGEEQHIGTVENEKDMPIVHREQQDKIWFYSTSFLVPAIVLLLGFKARRRIRGSQT